MTEIPSPERITRKRVAALVSNNVGYRLFVQWTTREEDRQNKSELLLAILEENGYSSTHVSASMNNLQAAADATCTSLYKAKLRTYQFAAPWVAGSVRGGPVTRDGAPHRMDESGQQQNRVIGSWQRNTAPGNG